MITAYSYNSMKIKTERWCIGGSWMWLKYQGICFKDWDIFKKISPLTEAGFWIPRAREVLPFHFLLWSTDWGKDCKQCSTNSLASTPVWVSAQSCKETVSHNPASQQMQLAYLIKPFPTTGRDETVQDPGIKGAREDRPIIYYSVTKTKYKRLTNSFSNPTTTIWHWMISESTAKCFSPCFYNSVIWICGIWHIAISIFWVQKPCAGNREYSQQNQIYWELRIKICCFTGEQQTFFLVYSSCSALIIWLNCKDKLLVKALSTRGEFFNSAKINFCQKGFTAYLYIQPTYESAFL